MSQEQMHARHLVELGTLEQVVNALGYASQLVERSAQLPYHTLLVELEADQEGRPHQLALNYYPVAEDQLEHSLLLQYFVPLPFSIPAEAVPGLAQVLPEINNKVVLGHFGFTAGQPQLHYRYVQALPASEPLNAEAVTDVLVLVGYTPMLFEALLEALAQGAVTVEEARAKIEAVYVEA